MCGVFGFVVQDGVSLTGAKLQNLTEILFRYSESRGKESAGITVLDRKNAELFVFKQDIPAADFVRQRAYKEFTNKALPATKILDGLMTIGHSRMVTNGTEKNNANNQPVTKLGCTMVHNGIITNVEEIWRKIGPEINRVARVDTEALAALIGNAGSSGQLTAGDVADVFAQLEGAASVGLVFDDAAEMVLATNTGSQYWWYEDGIFVFASERYILTESLREWKGLGRNADLGCRWLEPNNMVSVGVGPNAPQMYDFSGHPEAVVLQRTAAVAEIRDHSVYTEPPAAPDILLARPNLLEYHAQAIAELRRCAKCILPETFPYISFDEKGVCNFCGNAPTRNSHTGSPQDFERILERFRKGSGQQDCIVAFSGGRDSSYGLHILKNELGMNPVTFTYDWGMVTDLARRNIARMCGELGVENILVSADIKQKRDNIRKNVSAWLKRPSLGMIPLFMAGDKYFFYYVNKVKRETGIDIDIWSSNRYENTDFKAGFSGIPPAFEKKRVSSLSKLDLLRLPAYYAKEFALNPGYINSSIPDTLGSYWSYYFEPRREFYLMFDYLPWVEEDVEACLINQYGWETHPDTKSTWRIGDGTAAFYNYVYVTAAGFSEFDTFRSNQIRAGAMEREEALAKVKIENRPNLEWFQWYCDTNNLDYETLARGINDIPKLYPI